MNSKAFLSGISDICDKYKVSSKDIIKLAFAMRPQEVHHVPTLEHVSNMATGSAPTQLSNDSLAGIIQSLKDIGRFGKPLDQRQPFSN